MVVCRADIKAAAIGMILGDGSLTRPAKPTHGVALRASNIQEDYVRFKAAILEQLTQCTVYEASNGNGFAKNTDATIWVVRSRNHPLFADLRQRFYFDGRKTIDPHLMSCLDAQGLALWYLDDGSLAVDTMKVRFHTDCFNEAEHLVMTHGLWQKFGLRFDIQHGWQRGKKQLRLYLRAPDREKFFEIVKPTVLQVPSMLYKLPTVRGTERITSGRAQRIEAIVAARESGELQQMYRQGMSLREIGNVFNINADAIQRQLVKAGIEIRQGSYGTHQFLANDARLTAEVLQVLYVQQGLSAATIGAQFDMDEGGIISRLRRFGIPVRSRSGWRSVKRWSDLPSDREKQAEMSCSSELTHSESIH